MTSAPDQEVTTSAELARLRAEGKPITLQELEELEARATTLERMARVEDRLRHLESRKRTSETLDEPGDRNRASVAPGALPLLA